MNFARWLFEHSARSAREFLVGHRVDPLSHAEQWRRVAALSAAVAARGSGRNYLLLAPNGPFLVTTYLGTMLAGNVIVPLEPRISGRELDEVVRTCRPEAVFLDAAAEGRASELEGLELLRESDLPGLGPESTGADVGPDELAVILFTSGTTGRRKGVMLSHGNLRANTESILAYFDLDADDRMLVALPFSYCFGASLLHTHLRVGASLALTNPISLGAVAGEIDAWRCTGLAGVPSTYQILARKTEFLARELPTLRYMAQAGGKLPDETILEFAEAFPDKDFYVMYGATEATARLAYLPPERLRDKLGSVGHAITGVTLEVLDERGRPVRPGACGEIVVSGASVMQGYYEDPEATAEVLRGGKLHTGDLATVDDDGFIRIVGRAKRMIKSAGHRISPVEIEAVILSVQGVEDCRVLGVPDELLGEAVVAVVEGQANGGQLERAILGRCRTELPSFMLPQRVELVAALPLTASNKVDLPRLRSMLGRAG